MKKQAQLFNEQGHLTDGAIILYTKALNQNKIHELPDELLEHLEECDACRNQVFQYILFSKEFNKTTSNLSPDLSRQIISNKLGQKTKAQVSSKQRILSPFPSWIIGIAATISILIVSLIIIYNVPVPKPSPSPQAQSDSLDKNNSVDMPVASTPQDTNTSPEAQDTPMNPVEPSPEPSPDSQTKPIIPNLAEEARMLLETQAIAYLDEQILRNTSRAESLDVTYPSLDTIFQKNILFEWKNTQDQLELHVFSKENEEKPFIFTIEPGETRFIPEITLQKGLYYWTIFAFEQDFRKRIALGRFFYIP